MARQQPRPDELKAGPGSRGSVEGSSPAPEPSVAIDLLIDRGARVREEELDRALGRLDLSPAETRAVRGLADRLVGRLLSRPVERLSDPAADGEVARIALELFEE